MPMIVETQLFTFNELSDDAKEKAREWYRQGHLDDDWWDTVYSDFEAICEILGIALKTTSRDARGRRHSPEALHLFSRLRVARRRRKL